MELSHFVIGSLASFGVAAFAQAPQTQVAQTQAQTQNRLTQARPVAPLLGKWCTMELGPLPDGATMHCRCSAGGTGGFILSANRYAQTTICIPNAMACYWNAFGPDSTQINEQLSGVLCLSDPQASNPENEGCTSYYIRADERYGARGNTAFSSSSAGTCEPP